MKRLLLTLLLFPFAAFAQTAAQPGCAAYKTNLANEFKIWDMPAVPVQSVAKPEAIPEIKVGVHHAVALHPHPSVTFGVKPERDRGGPAVFSGIVKVTVAEAGLYRVSTGANQWIDVLRGTAYTPSPQFENATGCPIAKTVGYQLNAGETLTLQVSGNPANIMGIIVSKAAQ